MKRSVQKDIDSYSFSKTLAALMAEKGIGVREAARAAGIAPSTLINWRGGALPEDFQAVKRLAEFLGTTFSYLLTGEDDSRPDGSCPSIAEVFEDDGSLYDGYAKIIVKKLIPKNHKTKKETLNE